MVNNDGPQPTHQLTDEALVHHLSEKLEAAAAASERKSIYIAAMSHEIRTPIASILGMTELLLGTDGLKHEHREWLDAIKQSSTSLLSILNDVIDMSKIEADKLQLIVGEFSLAETLSHVFQTLSLAAEAKKLMLIYEIDRRIPTELIGDAGRIRQILVNLVTNAIKFTPSGRITVRIKLENETDTCVQLRFEVQDTGIGIAPEMRSTAFGLFSQGRGPIAAQAGGAGLGLAISKRLVDLMGGEIDYESAPGHGTTFWFTLTLEKVQTVRSAVHASKPKLTRRPVSGRRGRILIVEDHEMNRMIAKKMLESLGHEVETAETGTQAMERALAEPFDLILMDCMLPEIDGYEATRRIREAETELCGSCISRAECPATGTSAPGHHVMIVALTANAMTGAADQCIAAGMDGYLSKPFLYEDLALAVEKWLNRPCPLKN